MVTRTGLPVASKPLWRASKTAGILRDAEREGLRRECADPHCPPASSWDLILLSRSAAISRCFGSSIVSAQPHQSHEKQRCLYLQLGMSGL
jgi:hypothetical protein